MSVAFTKEDSAETAAETMLPDRPISDAPNLVTAAGLQALERQLAAARADYDAAMTIEDVNERRRQAANPFRDLRYFTERLRTAQLIPVPAGHDAVRHAIDWALVKLKDNGALDELYLRWFPVGFY